MNRTLLTALFLENNRDVLMTAAQLDVDDTVVRRAITNYADLSNKEQALLDSRLIYLTDVTFDGTQAQLFIKHAQSHIQKGYRFLEKYDDERLSNLYFTIVANGYLKDESDYDFIETLGFELAYGEVLGALNLIQNDVQTIDKMKELYEIDGHNIFKTDSQFWAYFREIFYKE